MNIQIVKYLIIASFVVAFNVHATKDGHSYDGWGVDKLSSSPPALQSTVSTESVAKGAYDDNASSRDSELQTHSTSDKKKPLDILLQTTFSQLQLTERSRLCNCKGNQELGFTDELIPMSELFDPKCNLHYKDGKLQLFHGTFQNEVASFSDGIKACGDGPMGQGFYCTANPN